MDSLTKEHRSWNMSRIRSTDTKPEMLVRSFLHRNGFRFRLHGKSLPGKPDIVLPKYKVIIEVRGCFWHLHPNCNQARIPKTRPSWWRNKLKKNVERDNMHCELLMKEGWRIIIVWGCVFKDIPTQSKPFFPELLVSVLKKAINDTAPFLEVDRDMVFHSNIPKVHLS